MTNITTRMLDCGMPLIVETMSGVKSAGLTWLIPAGGANDPEDRRGLSAMWAELLMRGAGDLGSRSHADALDRLGVNRSTDLGMYHLRVGASMVGDRLLDALPLLVDMVRRPRFDDDSIEPTRDLALQALESLRDDPHERAAVAAKDRHFPPPLNRSTLGTEAGLRGTTRTDLVEGWARFARPGRSILAIAGAVDVDAVARRLGDLLHGWTGMAPEFTLAGTPPRGYAHEIDETNQVQVIVLHDAPREADPDSVLERVVVSVLSGGMSGRLFTEVREKRGLCYSVSAGYGSGREFGSVSAYVGTTPERAQESLDVLLAELNRINEGGVEADEFRRAIVGMKSRLIFSGESTGARAAALAHDQHRIGRPRSLDELAAQVDGVTLERVNAYLRRRSLGRLTIQTLGPKALTAVG